MLMEKVFISRTDLWLEELDDVCCGQDDNRLADLYNHPDRRQRCDEALGMGRTHGHWNSTWDQSDHNNDDDNEIRGEFISLQKSI